MGRVTEGKGPEPTEGQKAQAARRRSTKPTVLRPIPRERSFSRVPVHPTVSEAAVAKPASLPIRTTPRRRDARPTVIRPSSRARALTKVSEYATESEASLPPVPDRVMAQPTSSDANAELAPSEAIALLPLGEGVAWPAPSNDFVPVRPETLSIKPTHPELKPIGRPPRQEPYRMLREPKPPGYKYLDKYTKEELIQMKRRTFEERSEQMERRFRELRIKYAPLLIRTPLKLMRPNPRQRKARASRK